MYRDVKSNINCMKAPLDDGQSRAIRLHLACGNIFLDRWVNIDYEARIPGVIQCDLTKGIPFKNETVDEILASHFLEHLKLKHEAIPFLQECHRVLKPGGIMSFITPNFEIIHRSYISKGTGAVASAMFGDGRTMWDYHISAWWTERFRQLAQEGCIHTPAGSYKVWESVELVKIITLWRLHSPYEVTVIYRKSGGALKQTYPTWLDRHDIVGDGFMSPFEWHLRQFISRYPACINLARMVKQSPGGSAIMNTTNRTLRRLTNKLSTFRRT